MILLVLGLIGGVVWLVFPSRRHLSVEISYPVIGHVGDILDIPINVDPVTVEDLTLAVKGTLPAGLVLDSANRRLYGNAQSPGSFPIVVRAAAPGFKDASASTTILIGSNRATLTALTLQVPPQIHGRVGEWLEVPLTVEPAGVANPVLTVTGDLPAGVTVDERTKRLQGTPQSPGSSEVVIKASAPGYLATLAATSLTISPAGPSAGTGTGFIPSLRLTVPPEIEGRVGERLEVPLTVEPAGVTNPVLVVEGDLPAGVTLDTRAKRLGGIPQTPGTSEVTIKASAPGYTATLAPVKLTVAAASSPSDLVETYDLVLAGSNTIGGVDATSQKGLARDLVNEFCRKRWPNGALVQQELKDVGKDEKDRVITYKLPTGELHRILIRPHGSHLATDALLSTDPGAQADVGMSSIPLPELQQDFYEFVIALDAVAVIVNPDNPIVEMTLDELKNIFGPNPSMTRWDDGNPIRTYGRDTNAGITDFFRAFTGIDKALESQRRGKGGPIPYTGIPAGQSGQNGYEDTSKVIEKVAADPYGIGYVGHAAILPASVKVIAIRPAPRYSAFSPNARTIRTMDYCLATELYFYLPHRARPLAAEFVRFCLTEDGQAVVDDDGFVGFRSANLLARPVFGDRAPPALRSAVANCDRIVLSFRFRAGSSDVLDATGSENWKILIEFLRLPDVANRHLVIAGFTDSSDTVAASYQTSRACAAAFAAQLARAGVGNPVDKILGFGKDYLLCDDKGNPNSREAQKNRRVNVYLAR
ncbi:MAG: substrate-binding domain-containing protein [Verrucomicrobia bacterium]|nr:substrate-binding domain-containing protein [Verrucomicrobiota bacterium]